MLDQEEGGLATKQEVHKHNEQGTFPKQDLIPKQDEE